MATSPTVTAGCSRSPLTQSLARRFGWQGCLDTKGLEFDGIVVVRPQEIEDESVTGRSTL